ncbi:MAG: hypothetical protein J6N93_07175 [Clostridia bacterium]|nr:hypothetical protein [Clostridia bacterium]
MAKKKDKEKVIYYDDNSTIVDMSDVTGIGRNKVPKRQKVPSTFKEKMGTFWFAFKLMLIPTAVVLAIIGILYLLIRLIVH